MPKEKLTKKNLKRKKEFLKIKLHNNIRRLIMFNFKSSFNELRDNDKNELYNIIQSFISKKTEKASEFETTLVDEREKFVENMIEDFSTKQEQPMPWCCGFGKRTILSERNSEKQSFMPWDYFKARTGIYPWETMKKWFNSNQQNTGPMCCGPWS